MDVVTLLGQIASQGPLAALLLFLWWTERKERVALAKQVQVCLESKAEHDAGAN